MLNIKNLHAGYGELNVLKGVDITVKPKEIVALIGPNGAGKSTVIKSIFGLTDIRKGTLSYKNYNLRSLKSHALIDLGISYVNQGKVIFGNLTVKENLIVGAEQSRKVSDEDLAYAYKKFPALQKHENRKALSLSGGQRQMLALGRALMQHPSLLLLDEPSLGLSPILQKELFASIAKLRDEGMSILIVEQNAKKAIEMADRTYLLEDGKIVLEGKDIVKHKKIKDVYLGGRY